MSPQEKRQNFQEELNALLIKYGVTIELEETRGNYGFDNARVVIEFAYDEGLFEDNFTGLIEQINLGTYYDGK